MLLIIETTSLLSTNFYVTIPFSVALHWSYIALHTSYVLLEVMLLDGDNLIIL